MNPLYKNALILVSMIVVGYLLGCIHMGRVYRKHLISHGGAYYDQTGKFVIVIKEPAPWE